MSKLANPFGANQFDREPAQGEVKRLQEAQKAAPLSGAPFSALHAPRRSQRHATGQDRPRGSRQAGGQEIPGAPIHQPGVEPDRYREFLATTWQQAASLPGASPLVKRFAEEASGGLPS